MTFKYSFISKTLQIKQCDFASVKGILHQKNFYCLNLIFWKIMGCGIARFGRNKSLKSFISGIAPRNPMAPPLETPWRRPSKPLRRPSKPHGAVPRNPRCAAPQNPWGQNLRPKFSSFGGFQALPTKTSNTTPHYYPKYEIQAIENFLVEDPFNTIYQESFCQHETYFVDKTMICETGVSREIKGNEEQGN